MTVQPNLVNSTGELGKELEKMRMLAARLAYQIERVRGEDLRAVDGEEERGLDKDDEERLRELVGGLV